MLQLDFKPLTCKPFNQIISWMAGFKKKQSCVLEVKNRPIMCAHLKSGRCSGQLSTSESSVFHIICADKSSWKKAAKYNLGKKVVSFFLFVCFCMLVIALLVTLTSQTHSTPAQTTFTVTHGHDTESNLCWCWLGLACETTLLVCFCESFDQLSSR